MVKLYDSKFDVMNKFTKVGDGPTFYGIEIEIEFKDDNDRTAFSQQFYDEIDNDKFLLKREPSILCGLEIVSAPLDIKHLTASLRYILEICHTHHAKTSERTGIHIHVTKNMDYKKIFQFINNPLDREEFISFSGRLSEYARYTTRTFPYNKGRGYCVNIYPKNTIEFRMFLCKLEYEWICGCLYFCEIVTQNINKLSRYTDLLKLCDSYPVFFKTRLESVTHTPQNKKYPIIYPICDNPTLW